MYRIEPRAPGSVAVLVAVLLLSGCGVRDLQPIPPLAVDDAAPATANTSATITTVAGVGRPGFHGDGEVATRASLLWPSGAAVDSAGNVYIADTDNHRIRKVDAVTGIITTFAGDGIIGNARDGSFGGDRGPAASARLDHPHGVTVDGQGNVFIADSGNHRIRRMDNATSIITTVAGNGYRRFSGDDGPAIMASIRFPVDVAVDAEGNLFIAALSSRVRRVDAATGIITTVAGNGMLGFSGDGGPATVASLDLPKGLALDSHGNLFIADLFNHRVRRVDAATGIITTFTGGGSGELGDGGPATAAKLSYPERLAVDRDNNVYISDWGHNRIRRVDAVTGIITSVAGNGRALFRGDGGAATSASLYHPFGVAFDGNGNLFIVDSWNNRVRKVEAAGKSVARF